MRVATLLLLLVVALLVLEAAADKGKKKKNKDSSSSSSDSKGGGGKKKVKAKGGSSSSSSSSGSSEKKGKKPKQPKPSKQKVAFVEDDRGWTTPRPLVTTEAQLTWREPSTTRPLPVAQTTRAPATTRAPLTTRAPVTSWTTRATERPVTEEPQPVLHHQTSSFWTSPSNVNDQDQPTGNERPINIVVNGQNQNLDGNSERPQERPSQGDRNPNSPGSSLVIEPLSPNQNQGTTQTSPDNTGLPNTKTPEEDQNLASNAGNSPDTSAPISSGGSVSDPTQNNDRPSVLITSPGSTTPSENQVPIENPVVIIGDRPPSAGTGRRPQENTNTSPQISTSPSQPQEHHPHFVVVESQPLPPILEPSTVSQTPTSSPNGNRPPAQGVSRTPSSAASNDPVQVTVSAPPGGGISRTPSTVEKGHLTGMRTPEFVPLVPLGSRPADTTANTQPSVILPAADVTAIPAVAEPVIHTTHVETVPTSSTPALVTTHTHVSTPSQSSGTPKVAVVESVVPAVPVSNVPVVVHHPPAEEVTVVRPHNVRPVRPQTLSSHRPILIYPTHIVHPAYDVPLHQHPFHPYDTEPEYDIVYPHHGHYPYHHDHHPPRVLHHVYLHFGNNHRYVHPHSVPHHHHKHHTGRFHHLVHSKHHPIHQIHHGSRLVHHHHIPHHKVHTNAVLSAPSVVVTNPVSALPSGRHSFLPRSPFLAQTSDLAHLSDVSHSVPHHLGSRGSTLNDLYIRDEADNLASSLLRQARQEMNTDLIHNEQRIPSSLVLHRQPSDSPLIRLEEPTVAIPAAVSS